MSGVQMPCSEYISVWASVYNVTKSIIFTLHENATEKDRILLTTKYHKNLSKPFFLTFLTFLFFFSFLCLSLRNEFLSWFGCANFQAQIFWSKEHKRAKNNSYTSSAGLINTLKSNRLRK